MVQPNPWKPASTATDCRGRSVHIWKLSLVNNSEEVSGGSLSRDEIKRAERFCFDSDREKFVRTRNTLRNLLSRYAGIAAKELSFSYNAHGKPSLCDLGKDNSLFFNVSHSQDIALFAFTRLCEVGIDIEYMRGDVKCLNLAQRFFSEQEYQALARLSGHELVRGFYRCWTRKEAFIKAVGSGLSLPLDSFAVNLENDDKPELLWADPTCFQGTCTMFPILHDEEYCASLACLGEPEWIEFYCCP